MADQGAFEYLGRLLAPQLTEDYTTLFSGKAQQVKRQDLMAQWANFLPGFDATFRDLSNMKIDTKDDSTKATVDFTASHWLGEDGFWSVSGVYAFTLKRTDTNWQITSIKLNREGEKGDRAVLNEAPKAAQANLKARKAKLVHY